MGEHTNNRWFNLIAWFTALVVIGLSIAMLFVHGS
jgi:Mn2+/Fe2+ NRAMP family transporter